MSVPEQSFWYNPETDPGLPHLLSALQIDRQTFDDIIIPLVQKSLIQLRQPQRAMWTHLVVDGVFYLHFEEPSTRTRISFEHAILNLKGRPIVITDVANTTSFAKGEDIEMTTRMWRHNHPVAVVMRTGNPTDPLTVARLFEDYPGTNPNKLRYSFVINGGNGLAEHPTQAILDLVAICEVFGRIDDLSIMICGDLAHARTINSLLILLSRITNNNRICLAVPVVNGVYHGPPEYLKQILCSSNLVYEEKEIMTREDFVALAREVDIVYSTRPQVERYEDIQPDVAAKLIELTHIDPDFLDTTGVRLFHPLPHQNEIHPDVRRHPSAMFELQASRGVPVRMAIICWLANYDQTSPA